MMCREVCDLDHLEDHILLSESDPCSNIRAQRLYAAVDEKDDNEEKLIVHAGGAIPYASSGRQGV